MTRRRNSYADDFARIRKYLAGHEGMARQSRAFDFREPTSSNYAYALTWTPGSIALSGDCGEMVITHYNALWTLKEGLHWAAFSDYDYLLGKTNLRQSYDPEATFEWLRDHLNDDAIHARKDQRKELQRWRRDKPTSDAFPEPEELAEELEWWADGGRPETLKVEPRGPYACRWDTVGEWVAPDGWRNWLRAWSATSWSTNPNDIFTHRGRAQILDQIRERCDQREDACKLKDDLGIDDWYGEQRWTFSDLLKIQCVRRGARQALEVLRWEEFEADPYGWSDQTFTGKPIIAPRSAFVDWIAVSLVREAGLPRGFAWGKSASGLALEGAERVLADMLDAASGGYNQAHSFVHTPGRYGQMGIDWSPEGAARMVIEWFADAALFWATDEVDLPEDFDFGVDPEPDAVSEPEAV